MFASKSELVSRFDECPPAARALPIEPIGQGPERRRLRQRQDSSKCQWRAMGVVAVGDSTGGMAEDFDGRLGHVRVVVGCASLAKILEHPGSLLARFNAPLRWYTGKSAQHSKSVVRSSAAAEEHRRIRIWVVGHDALEVQSNCAIHRPPERFVCLYRVLICQS
jgi:hypothetical protein